MMTNNERDTMTERERITKLIDDTLTALEGPPPGFTPAGAVAMINALESLVTARAMLGEEPAAEAPRLPGLTQEQARLLREAATAYLGGDEETGSLLSAIDANTIGGR